MITKILKILNIVVKIVTWLIANGIPFLRGIIEEIKNAQAKKAAK